MGWKSGWMDGVPEGRVDGSEGRVLGSRERKREVDGKKGWWWVNEWMGGWMEGWVVG